MIRFDIGAIYDFRFIDVISYRMISSHLLMPDARKTIVNNMNLS